MKYKLIVHENEGKREPDICGEIIELINESISNSKLMSIATVFIEPGEESKTHYHKIMEEIYYIIEGEGEIFIDEFVKSVKTGHAIFIPIGSTHKIKNTGKNVLKFISVDSPTFDIKDIYFK